MKGMKFFILSFQISLKAEMEVAMKLLEKDIHDKQDTIISLRRQLDDIKLINLEMYKKLQVRHFSFKFCMRVFNKIYVTNKKRLLRYTTTIFKLRLEL